MRHEIVLPDIGDGITEAFVTEWLVEPGATVEPGQELVEVMSDKVNLMVESEVAGRLVERCVAEEARVQVGDVLAVVDTPDAPA